MLRHAKGADGKSVVQGKQVTGFTNSEEKASGLTDVVPFLVEDMLQENGGQYSKAGDWQPHVLTDGLLITGQNPASSHPAAKALLKKLGWCECKGCTPWRLIRFGGHAFCLFASCFKHPLCGCQCRFVHPPLFAADPQQARASVCCPGCRPGHFLRWGKTGMGARRRQPARCWCCHQPAKNRFTHQHTMTAPALLCIAIAGPTASGKTAGALAVAAVLAKRHTPVEIISVDSALVYRGMDIGTAKPTPAELAAAPHHLIDIRDPLHAYSAADFVRDATRLIAEVRARGALPLLVGGTMLYFKALMDGIDPMPAADPAVRAQIEARALAHGWPALHAELAQVDPATAARLAPADSQRIQRALEVWQVSGQPLSSFHTNATKNIAAGAQPISAGVLFSLEPQDRAWLHARIALRFDAMLQAGLVDEVRGLRARGDLHPDLPSMRCVGYRQTWEALDFHASHPAGAPLDLALLRERGMAATRQLAKRQITWLRSMPQRQQIACDAPDATAQLVQAVLERLERLERSA